MRTLATVTTFLALAVAAPAWSAPEKDRVEPLELARVLLLDGHPQRALAALGEVDEASEGLDRAELLRLRGLAEHALGLYVQAVEDFRGAIALGATGTPLRYGLADAQLATGDAQGALDTLAAAPKDVWSEPGAHRVRALALYRLGDKTRAFDAADAGFARFPGEVMLARVRVQVLLELGLSEEGLPALRAYFARADVTREPAARLEEYLGFAQALASAGRGADQRALVLLEEIVLRFPDALAARERLARAYAAHGRHRSAAEVLRPYASEDPRLALLAAELYAKAGKVEDALRLNTLVTDSRLKLRQRLSILVNAERYAEAAALDAPLARLGLLEDDKLRYAVAYAQYVAGNGARVSTLLGRVSEPALFAKATALQRALEVCSADVWRCD